MKTLAFVALATSAIAAVDDTLPQAYNRERYEETRTTSPFVLATKAEPVKTEDAPQPFANLYVVGVGRVDGKEYATIVRHGEEAKPIRLFGSTPDEEGYVLQQVVWSDSFGKSRVKIKKGSDTGEIGFDENATKQAIAGTPVAPVPGVTQPGGNRPPGAPAQTNGGNFRPPTVPQTFSGQQNAAIPRPGGITPTIGGASAIPRPTGGAIPPSFNNGGNNGANGGNTQSRQRIRVIGK